MVGIIIFIGLAAFIAVLIIRTLRFVPAPLPEIQVEEVSVNEAKIVADMRDMIRCKTVSSINKEEVDWEEFEKFRNLLKERFPLVHGAFTLERVGETGLLYFLKGKSSAAPSVLMAHYDVVPVEEAAWEKPPFDACLEDGIIWGRGTLDTKGTFCGIMEALEQVLAEGYAPANDLYLSFSGEEEVSGESCPQIVSVLESRGIHPAFVLDEGGAVVENVFPGVKCPCAVVGIAEKVGMNVELTMESEGGHASTPPAHTILGKLSAAVVAIENHPFPAHFTKPVAEMFDVLGRHSTFGMRLIFANLWCFLPILKVVCKVAGGELNALMRTTVAVTKMQGSDAFNVLPPAASVGMNLRLNAEDTPDSAVAYLQKVIKNDKIKVSVQHAMEPSGCSDTHCAQWDLLSDAIRSTWTDAVVSPYLMLACSDSRHYSRISNNVYKFSAMALSKKERGMIHGHNEQVPVETLLKTVQFYLRLLKKL